MGNERCRAVALLLLCGALAGSAAADDTALEMFEVQNRTAASLVAALEPHLGEGGAVTAHGSTLIVRVRRDRIEEIRRLVAALDTPARMLALTVERRDDRSAHRTDVGGAVVVSSEGIAVAGAAHQEAAEEKGAETQMLQVLEGSPAQLDLGVSVPVAIVGVAGGPYDPTVVQGTEFVPVVSGLSVVPTVTGSGTVVLELGLEGGRLREDGSIERDVVNTTVTGQLGQWIEVGSAVRQLAARGTGLLGLSKELSERQLTMRVRVDEGG